MRRLRSVLFWTHLACGVTAGLVILLMCVTGVALTYQRQMQWWADTRHYRAEPPADSRRASVAELVAAARRLDPSAAPSALTLRAQPSAPAAVTLGARTAFLNPYTADLHGEGTGQGLRAFFATMVSWHRYVGQAGERRPAGKAIAGAANVAFLAIVLSGMYLWWPRILRWNAIRQVVWFRRGLPGKARDFNWHNTLGFWSALPLALIVFSGAVISYPRVSNLVYRAYGEAPPPPPAPRPVGPAAAAAGAPAAGYVSAAVPEADENLDAIVAAAAAVMADWNILVVRLPLPAEGPLTIALDAGDGGQPHLRGTLTLARDGEVERWEDASALTPGRRARNFLRFAHTGEVAGLAGQTIAGIVSAAGAVLVYTGLALALRRFLTWRRRMAA